MSVLLIVSHPNPASLNHAIAERVSGALADEGIAVHAHDLYQEHFQPVLENEEILRRFAFDEFFTRYTRELAEARGLFLIYPDWWGMPPAILKGWIDRIFRPGVAYQHDGPEFMAKTKTPLLVGKKVFVVVTTNETNPLSQEAMAALWRERVFGYVGVEDVTIKTLYGIRESTGRQRREWLDELEQMARRWL